MARRSRRRKGGLAGAGAVLIAAGAQQVSVGQVYNGTVLIAIGAVLIAVAKYI